MNFSIRVKYDKKTKKYYVVLPGQKLGECTADSMESIKTLIIGYLDLMEKYKDE